MICSIFTSDPISGGSGSSGTAPARSGLKTQYVLRHRLIFLLYIVFTPFPATLRAGADIAALFIPSPCYTSGKLLYDGKSDLPETGIR